MTPKLAQPPDIPPDPQAARRAAARAEVDAALLVRAMQAAELQQLAQLP
jgi:hypothetical protein